MDYFQYLERTVLSSIDLNLTPFSSSLALHQEGERINKQGSRGRHGKLISDGLTSPPRSAADGQGEDPSNVFSRSRNRWRVAAHRDKRRARQTIQF
jgi:hypothetical protein